MGCILARLGTTIVKFHQEVLLHVSADHCPSSRWIVTHAASGLSRTGFSHDAAFQHLKNRTLIPPPVMTHPDRWHLDQLLAWEEKRIALAEAALEDPLSPRREELTVTDLLPQPQRRRHAG